MGHPNKDSFSNALADAYQLWVGTAIGNNNLGVFSTTANSATVTGLPGLGTTVFVRLYSRFGATWLFNSYSYISN